MSTGAARTVGVLFGVAFAVAAVMSPYPLIRVACTLGLASLIGGVLIGSRVSQRVCARLTGVVLAFMLVAFAAMWVCTSHFGGGALNGHIRGTQYFLSSHGRETEVSQATYWLVAVLELAVFASWPLGFALAARMRLRVDAGSAPGARGAAGRPRL